jgi:cell division protein FtsZ
MVVREVVAEDAEIIFGAAIDESLGDEVKVTVIATGFQPQAQVAEDDYYEEEEQPPEDAPAEEVRQETTARGPFGGMPEVDVELPAFLRRGVSTRY